MYLGSFQATFAVGEDKWLPGIGTISVPSKETVQQTLHTYKCENCGHEPELLGEATEPFYCRECQHTIAITPAPGNILAQLLLRKQSNLPHNLLEAMVWQEDPQHQGVWQGSLSKRPNWKVIVWLPGEQFMMGTFECSEPIEDASFEQLTRAGEEEYI